MENGRSDTSQDGDKQNLSQSRNLQGRQEMTGDRQFDENEPVSQDGINLEEQADITEGENDDQQLRDYVLARDRVRRQTRPPSRYAHAEVIAFALNIGDSLELEEPLTYKEACSSKNMSSWMKAMREEMNSL